jgi:hypothetical protein
MEKTRARAKTKKQVVKLINLEFDVETYDKLYRIAQLSGTTINQTISVILATYLVDDKQYHNKQLNYPIGLGEK